MARTHYFPSDVVHFTWDEGREPVMTVESGDTVVVHTRDVSDNQITPESTTADIDRLDWDRVYPLAGPIAIADAEPGDTLAVEVLDLHTEGWGWTPTTSRTPICASSTSPTASSRASRTPPSRSTPSSVRWASAPPARPSSP